MRSLVWGAVAGLGLLALYAVTMTALAQSWEATITQFRSLWFLMVPLAAGFGVQVGLYVRLKARQEMVATSGATATVGMLACCAHHLADILPILGLSAASIFLVRYQAPILAVSLAVNWLGILWILRLSR